MGATEAGVDEGEGGGGLLQGHRAVAATRAGGWRRERRGHWLEGEREEEVESNSSIPSLD
jgi:hypothetical protein